MIAGLKSFSLLVGQDNFQRFPFAEENQCVIEVCCNTLQLSTCPVIESQIQLGHSGFISRSCLHCSDDFLHSSSLKPSCPGTKHPGPIAPSTVFATEVPLVGISPHTLQIRIAHCQLQVPLAPWPHQYHQLETYLSHPLPSGSFALPAVLWCLACSADSSFCLCRSIILS